MQKSRELANRDEESGEAGFGCSEGKRKREKGKGKKEKGKRKMEKGKWKMENGKRTDN